VDELNLKVVPPPRIEVTKARVDVKADVFTAVQVSGAKSVATLAGRFPLPNVVERIMELLDHTAATPVRLTRKTVLAIVSGVKNQQAVLDNPTEFATIAADVIRAKLEEQLVHGIRYEPDGGWYEQTQFAEAFETQSGKVMDATKSLYDKFAYDSEVERKFAEKLEARDDVRFYVKPPNWFKVQTPIGNYNPDWAVVMEEVDQFGERGERLYLVRETKSTHNLGELRPEETQKLRCGTRHFCDALGVDYRLVVAADELPGGTKIN
jgi:type III restriction enzyme